jgi:hypothetical protein
VPALQRALLDQGAYLRPALDTAAATVSAAA